VFDLNSHRKPEAGKKGKGKAVEGHRTSRRWREFLRLPTTRSVLDCASPLALLSGDALLG